MSLVSGIQLIKKYEDGDTLSPDETQLLIAALYFWYRKAFPKWQQLKNETDKLVYSVPSEKDSQA